MQNYPEAVRAIALKAQVTHTIQHEDSTFIVDTGGHEVTYVIADDDVDASPMQTYITWQGAGVSSHD